MGRQAGPTGKRVKDQTFGFDRVFDETTTQGDVYEATTKPLLDSVLDGYNATVFAYGATGCGKTHTITCVDFRVRVLAYANVRQRHITTAGHHFPDDAGAVREDPGGAGDQGHRDHPVLPRNLQRDHPRPARRGRQQDDAHAARGREPGRFGGRPLEPPPAECGCRSNNDIRLH